jgi:hypothetical protein
MKGIKISKAVILILAAGVFIVGLLSLGVTRYNQMSEQSDLNDELALSEIRLSNMDLNSLELQLSELEEQLLESESQLEEAKNRLKQTVISVNVTDKLYEIAEFYNVIIDNIGTTKNQSITYNGIGCLSISVSAAVSGELSNIIDFIVGLNNNFDTGYVQSTQLTIYDDTAESGTSANIVMVVYSYEGG